MERRARTGAHDQGDIAGLAPFCIEAKSTARTELAAWVAEAKAEAINARVPFGVVWAKRKGKTSPADGYVVMDGSTFADLLLAQRALAQRINPLTQMSEISDILPGTQPSSGASVSGAGVPLPPHKENHGRP